MKSKIFVMAALLLGMGFLFTSCGDEVSDTCSNELGDVGADFQCSVSVYPQICTVDGVDDHWVLDGVEYACDGDCSDIPDDLVSAILALEGCGTKSVDVEAVTASISPKAKSILANLHMEAALCSN